MVAKQQKLINKFLRGSAFRWRELETLMSQLGWDKLEGSGSRVKFHKDGMLIELHRPHPGNELKQYQKKEIIKTLKQEGEI